MAKRRGYYEPYWPEPSRPKEVRGGIKSQSKRGAFANEWWGKRWIQTLESFNIGARLDRGRSYARKGQVADLEILNGEIRAKVQGSRSGAYRVSIKLKSFSEDDKVLVGSLLGARPVFAAKMLAGKMPEELVEVFSSAGLPLFPARLDDLKTNCSCPDWSNPCKHIAAVYYLIGEALDNDPFLLFRLRGMEREEIMQLLGGSVETPTASDDAEPVHEEHPPEPLPLDHSLFWGTADRQPPEQPVLTMPAVSAALPKRLGNIPFWRASTGFQDAMSRLYHEGAERATWQAIGPSDEIIGA